MTYEAWLQMPPVENGTDEVVRGEIILVPIRRYPHAEVISLVNRQLSLSVDSEARVLSSNFGLMISREPLTCRSPDLILFREDKMRIVDGLYCSPPELIVEVLSSSENRKRKYEKLEDYASIGLPEVWLISPEAQSVEVLVLENGKMERTAILVEGVLVPTQFPGVSVSIPDLFPE